MVFSTIFSVIFKQVQCPYKGRTALRGVIPGKPRSMGITLVGLAEPNGYMNAIAMQGLKNFAPTPLSKHLSHKGAILLGLLNEGGFLDCGRVCVTDNAYGSPLVSRLLFGRRTFSITTLRASAGFLPRHMMGRNNPNVLIQERGFVARKTDNELDLVVWRDSIACPFLSTVPFFRNQLGWCHRKQKGLPSGVDVSAPIVSLFYNPFMGGSSLIALSRMTSRLTQLCATGVDICDHRVTLVSAVLLPFIPDLMI